MEHCCKFCKKKFVNQYSLARHQKEAKYCLKIQNKKTIFCIGCNKEFTNNLDYDVHKVSCKDFMILEKDRIIKETQEEKENAIKEITETKDKIIKELQEEMKIMLDNKNVEIKNLQDKLAKVAEEHAKRPTNITNNNLNITQNIINNLNVYDISQIEANTENLTIDDISNGKKAAQYALENTFGNMLFNTDVNRGPLKALDCDRKIRNVDHDELTRDFFGGIKDKAREITKEEVEKRREEMKEKYKDCPYVNTNMDKKIDEMADNLGMIVGASKGRINKISREFKKEIYSQTNIKNLK